MLNMSPQPWLSQKASILSVPASAFVPPSGTTVSLAASTLWWPGCWAELPFPHCASPPSCSHWTHEQGPVSIPAHAGLCNGPRLARSVRPAGRTPNLREGFLIWEPFQRFATGFLGARKQRKTNQTNRAGAAGPFPAAFSTVLMEQPTKRNKADKSHNVGARRQASRLAPLARRCYSAFHQRDTLFGESSTARAGRKARVRHGEPDLARAARAS